MKAIKIEQILNSSEPDCIDFQVLARESAKREELRASFQEQETSRFRDRMYAAHSLGRTV